MTLPSSARRSIALRYTVPVLTDVEIVLRSSWNFVNKACQAPSDRSRDVGQHPAMPSMDSILTGTADDDLAKRVDGLLSTAVLRTAGGTAR
jgi:hypothetical protein